MRWRPAEISAGQSNDLHIFQCKNIQRSKFCFCIAFGVKLNLRCTVAFAALRYSLYHLPSKIRETSGNCKCFQCKIVIAFKTSGQDKARNWARTEPPQVLRTKLPQTNFPIGRILYPSLVHLKIYKTNNTKLFRVSKLNSGRKHTSQRNRHL